MKVFISSLFIFILSTQLHAQELPAACREVAPYSFGEFQHRVQSIFDEVMNCGEYTIIENERVNSYLATVCNQVKTNCGKYYSSLLENSRPLGIGNELFIPNNQFSKEDSNYYNNVCEKELREAILKIPMSITRDDSAPVAKEFGNFTCETKPNFILLNNRKVGELDAQIKEYENPHPLKQCVITNALVIEAKNKTCGGVPTCLMNIYCGKEKTKLNAQCPAINGKCPSLVACAESEDDGGLIDNNRVKNIEINDIPPSFGSSVNSN